MIHKLQEEIAKDTCLRKELLASLDLAKSSLKSELENLEIRLQQEKEAHCDTKNKLMLQEHESSALRVDRRSLKTGLETANFTIEKLHAQIQKFSLMQNDKQSLNTESKLSNDLEIAQSQLCEVKSAYEDSRMSINSLEDQLNEVRFHLRQKNSECLNLQSLLKVKEESYQSELNEIRSKSDNLRIELINLTKKLDKLSEEKNGYRAQVQDMNVALKNSLEHIKR